MGTFNQAIANINHTDGIGFVVADNDPFTGIDLDDCRNPERPSLRVADASIWDKPTNQNEKAEKLPSNAEIFENEGVYFDREVSIDAKKSIISGIHQIHDWLRVDEFGLPGLMVFSTCTNWWRTVPTLPVDPLDPERYDTDAEDHCADATRYLVSARPFRSRIVKPTIKPFTLAWYDRIEQEEKRAGTRRL